MPAKEIYRKNKKSHEWIARQKRYRSKFNERWKTEHVEKISDKYIKNLLKSNGILITIESIIKKREQIKRRREAMSAPGPPGRKWEKNNHEKVLLVQDKYFLSDKGIKTSLLYRNPKLTITPEMIELKRQQIKA